MAEIWEPGDTVVVKNMWSVNINMKTLVEESYNVLYILLNVYKNKTQQRIIYFLALHLYG